MQLRNLNIRKFLTAGVLAATLGVSKALAVVDYSVVAYSDTDGVSVTPSHLLTPLLTAALLVFAAVGAIVLAKILFKMAVGWFGRVAK